MRLKRDTILLLAAVVLVVILLPSCPAPESPIGYEGNDQQNFSWASPETDDVSTYTMSEYVDAGKGRFFVTDKKITPDSFKAAYRYIGLVPETLIEDMWEIGFQIYLNDGSWINNNDDFDIHNADKLPGFNRANKRYGDTPVFEGYFNDTTEIKISDILDSAFPIFDGTADDSIKIMDIQSGNTVITIEELPDLNQNYTGVVSEIVYHEVGIDDFGLIRYFYERL